MKRFNWGDFFDGLQKVGIGLIVVGFIGAIIKGEEPLTEGLILLFLGLVIWFIGLFNKD